MDPLAYALLGIAIGVGVSALAVSLTAFLFAIRESRVSTALVADVSAGLSKAEARFDAELEEFHVRMTRAQERDAVRFQAIGEELERKAKSRRKDKGGNGQAPLVDHDAPFGPGADLGEG